MGCAQSTSVEHTNKPDSFQENEDFRKISKATSERNESELFNISYHLENEVIIFKFSKIKMNYYIANFLTFLLLLKIY